jgi:predicted NBD/HSP70 family sugar kinase
VLEEVAQHLAVGISNVVWGLDADAIVIDGPITEAWHMIEPLLRQQLPDDSDLWGSRNLLVRPSAFSGEAALIGAAALPLASIFARGASTSSAARASR